MGEPKMIEIIAGHILTGVITNELLKLVENTGDKNGPSARDCAKS